MSNSLWPHGLQHTRLPYPSPTPRANSNLCPSSLWCHPTISSSVVPFSSHVQSFPASGSVPMKRNQLVKVFVFQLHLPTNIQDWFPLGCTGLISLQSKGLSRVFSNTPVQKYQFFHFLYSPPPYMTTGKTIALTRRNFVSKVMSLLFNMLSRLVIVLLPRASIF